jgi:predicted nuclease of predicted toxin-antitoxin system
VKFLIDECLHTSLTEVAVGHGHEGHHVVWLGLSGETDWDLMPRIIEENFTFVTNNAADFRKLFAREELHAGLVIIVPQVRPALQKELFGAVLSLMEEGDEPVNEVFEVAIEDGDIVIDRYALPAQSGTA